MHETETTTGDRPDATTKHETDATTESQTDATTDTDVLVVGGGVAGLTAAIYTARAEFETLLVSTGRPILERNAHLENVPGFPAGVNPRQFLDLTRQQADRAGAIRAEGEVVTVARTDDDTTDEPKRFTATLADGSEIATDWVVAASWADAEYLDELALDRETRGSKTFLRPDAEGRTAVDGLYAAGRLAQAYHQAVVAAGDGATAALSLIHDTEKPFYHDWVTPDGYFSDRGRDVPPGCTEIDEAERQRREAESLETMREAFAEPHPESQPTHPSLDESTTSDADGEETNTEPSERDDRTSD